MYSFFIVIMLYFDYKNEGGIHMDKTKSKCPKCGGEDIEYQVIHSGSVSTHRGTTGAYKAGRKVANKATLGAYGFLKGQRLGKTYTRDRYSKIAICKNCGHSWNVIPMFNKVYALFICILIAILFVWIMVPTKYERTEKMRENDKTIWADKYTNINDFDYVIDGDEIYINKYKGENYKVRLKRVYEIDGKQCKIVSFDSATFMFGKIRSVIIPEGTKYLANNTFNSSGVEFLYLPSSIREINEQFCGYLHDLKKLYYGGTEKQWRKVFKADREDLEVQEIVFNANPNELK